MNPKNVDRSVVISVGRCLLWPYHEPKLVTLRRN